MPVIIDVITHVQKWTKMYDTAWNDFDADEDQQTHSQKCVGSRLKWNELSSQSVDSWCSMQSLM